MQSIKNWFISTFSDRTLSYSVSKTIGSMTYTLALSTLKPENMVSDVNLYQHQYVKVKIGKEDKTHETLYAKVNELALFLGTKNSDVLTMSAEELGNAVKTDWHSSENVAKRKTIENLVKKGFKQFKNLTLAQHKAFNATNITTQNIDKLSVLFRTPEQRKRIFNTLLSVGQQLASHSSSSHVFKPASKDSYAFLIQDGEVYFNDELIEYEKDASKMVSSGRKLKDLELVAWQEARLGGAASQKTLMIQPRLFIYDGRELSKYQNANQIIQCYGHIANGLQEMHKKGAVHANVNPQNFASNGSNWVIIDETFSQPKSEYLAPECLQQGQQSEANQNSYALGVSLFESITGRNRMDSNQSFAEATQEDIQATIKRAKKDLETGLTPEQRNEIIKRRHIEKGNSEYALSLLQSNDSPDAIKDKMHKKLMGLIKEKEKIKKLREPSRLKEINQQIHALINLNEAISNILSNVQQKAIAISAFQTRIKTINAELQRLQKNSPEVPDIIKTKQTLLDWSLQLMDRDPTKRPSCAQVASAFENYMETRQLKGPPLSEEDEQALALGLPKDKLKDYWSQNAAKTESLKILARKGFKEFEKLTTVQRKAFNAINLMSEEHIDKLAVLFRGPEQRRRIFHTLLAIGEQLASHSGRADYHVYKPATDDSYAFLIKDGEVYFNDELINYGRGLVRTVSSGRSLSDLELVAWQEAREVTFTDRITGQPKPSTLDWVDQEQSHLQGLEKSKATNIAPPFSVSVRVKDSDSSQQKTLSIQKVFMYDGREVVKYGDERQIIQCFGDVATGLGCMHASNLVHADVRPNNFAFDGEKWVVIDLGSTTAKGAAQIAQSREYLAPEYIGKDNPENGFEGDSYALGVSLFEAMVGRTYPDGFGRDKPFGVTSPEKIKQHIESEKEVLAQGFLSEDIRTNRIKQMAIRREILRDVIYVLKYQKTIEDVASEMNAQLRKLVEARKKSEAMDKSGPIPKDNSIDDDSDQDDSRKIGDNTLSSEDINQYIHQFVQISFHVLKKISNETDKSNLVKQFESEAENLKSEINTLSDEDARFQPTKSAESIKTKQALLDWSLRLTDPDPSKRPPCRDVATAFKKYTSAVQKYEAERDDLWQKGVWSRTPAPVLEGPPVST